MAAGGGEYQLTPHTPRVQLTPHTPRVPFQGGGGEVGWQGGGWGGGTAFVDAVQPHGLDGGANLSPRARTGGTRSPGGPRPSPHKRETPGADGHVRERMPRTARAGDGGRDASGEAREAPRGAAGRVPLLATDSLKPAPDGMPRLGGGGGGAGASPLGSTWLLRACTPDPQEADSEHDGAESRGVVARGGSSPHNPTVAGSFPTPYGKTRSRATRFSSLEAESKAAGAHRPLSDASAADCDVDSGGGAGGGGGGDRSSASGQRLLRTQTRARAHTHTQKHARARAHTHTHTHTHACNAGSEASESGGLWGRARGLQSA